MKRILSKNKNATYILHKIYYHSQSTPSRVAMIINGDKFTYNFFAKSVEQARKTWIPLNLPIGTVAVVVSSNPLINWITVLALQSIGLITICVASIENIKNIDINNASCFFDITNSEKSSTFITNLFPDILILPHYFKIGLDIKATKLPNHLNIKEGGGHILLTSGTTGTYKKILQDSSQDLERCERRILSERFQYNSVHHLASFGLWTGVGYRRPLIAWTAGATILHDNRREWIKELGNHGVTHANLTPGELKHVLIHYSELQKNPPWKFELRIVGGFISPTTSRNVMNQLTPKLLISFGCTELWLPAMEICCTSTNLNWFTPFYDRSVQIVDVNHIECETGKEGMLRILIQDLDFKSYYEDNINSNKMFQDGWFYPGDMAVRRSDGFIKVLGRVTDVINVAGSKIASGPIEEALCEALHASAVCAFSGIQTDRHDMVVIAIETEKIISRDVISKIASNIISKINPVTFVQLSNFPRTTNGTLKIDRIELRRILASRFKGNQEYILV